MEEQRITPLAMLKGGAIEERWQEEMARLLANVDDPNTDAEAERVITLKLRVKPNEDRNMAHVSIETSTKLAGIRPVGTVMYLGRDHGALAAREAPQQADMFQTPTGKPKPVVQEA